MKQIADPKTLQELLAKLKAKGRTIGFVPTMGALHAGHLSLIKKSKKENDMTVASIFINPLQFGPKEDFKKYPRPLRQDLLLLKKEKVDFVFTPRSQKMFPDYGKKKTGSGFQMFPASLFPLMNALCGKFRPGHFQGVVTVVSRLFDIVRPDLAYLGAKDYQQAKIVEQLIRELRLSIKIKIEPTVREKDGLAMSSRNRYLSLKDRIRARAISRTLFSIREQIQSGEKNVAKILRQARAELAAYVDQIQYLEAVDPETLVSIRRIQNSVAILTACYVGKTRLIDNVIITTKVTRNR